jgi:hypothetical protein
MNDASPQKITLISALKTCGLSVLIAALLPFLYLTTTALLLSAYVHNFPLPSRAFLKAYAGPSNGLAGLPVVGTLYSNYTQVCIKLTAADHQRKHTKTDGSKSN